MRKIKTVFLLSVMILSVAGCATRTSKKSEDVAKIPETEEATEQVTEKETEEPTTEVKPEVTNVTDVTMNQTSEAESQESESRAGDKQDTSKKEEAKQSVQKEQQTSQPKEESTKAPEPKAEEVKPTKEPEVKPVEPEKPSAVAYDPNQVKNLAISKCQAGGMITTEDNLAKNLAEGKITQEEYNEYYPLDGLESSYYSVFVETDLNQAATTSGRKLGSVDGIAQYIADMLLLEQDPLFNITYTGVTTQGGTDFYEFRCHR